MSGVESGVHFEACGFWLPCDQANFIHHEGQKALRRSVDLSTFDRSEEPDDLQDQVLHRLVMVLPDWKYTYVVPVKHVSNPFGDDPDAAVFVNREFSGFRPGGPGSQADPYPMPAGVQWRGLALLVNSSGFYLWLLRYKLAEGVKRQTGMSKAVQEYLRAYLRDIVGGDYWSRYSGWPDDEPLASDAEKNYTLEMYRQNHRGILTFFQINTIFEGLFSSSLDFQVFFYDNASDDIDITRVKQHYSLGTFIDLISTRVKPADYSGAEPPTANPPTAPGESEHETAEPQNPGEEEEAEQQQIEATEGQKPSSESAGRKAAVTEFLIQLDGLYPHPQPQSGAVATLPRKRQPHLEEALVEEADHLCHNFLGAKGCGPLLLKFLQATASETLQNYKRRVERCRRALVGEIMEVTQRQEGVLQVEVPRAATPAERKGEYRTQDRRILGVTEAQLRGYVLLLSAKLPLVNNARLYIDGIVHNNHWYYQEYRARGTAAGQHADPKRQAKANRRSREVSAAIAMWTTLYKALASDLSGLEKAIRQEREDRMVQEEEKIRVEQETLAEIERLQERNAGSLSPQTSLTLGLLSSAFALASVLIALISINQHSSALFPTNPFPTNPGQYRPADLIGFIGAVLGLGLALLALYFLAHYGFVLVFRLAIRFLRVRWTGRYYYELDIHMEAPLDDAKARDLLDNRFEPPSYSNPFIDKTRLAHPKARDWVSERGLRFWNNVFWPGFRKPERNSYRVERQDANEAMHKVYIEVAAVFRRTHWYQVVRPRVNLVLVYEILFHRPAQTPRFILKDLRVISMQTRVVSTTTLAQIKRMIAVSFVNPLLMLSARTLEPEASIDPKTQRSILRDALMSLTKPEPAPQDSQSSAVDSGTEQAGGPRNAPPLAPATPEGEANGTMTTRRSLVCWFKHCSASMVRILAVAGLVGFAVYLSRVVFSLVGLASASGFGALVSGSRVAATLRVSQYVTFMRDNFWLLLSGPLAVALALTLLAALASLVASQVVASIKDALTLTDAAVEVDQKAGKRRSRTAKTPSQREEAVEKSAAEKGEPLEASAETADAGSLQNGATAAQNRSIVDAGTAVASASGPQDAPAAAGRTQDPSGFESAARGASQTMDGAQTSRVTSAVRLPLPLHAWRHAIVLGWVALSWTGSFAIYFLAVAKWMLRVVLASFGIALALPIIGGLLASVGLGFGH